MRTLYPDIRPTRSFQLAVQEPHVLHVEECGNDDGLPVLFVHGGPGAGCDAASRCFFDPERYRIVLFDQRGAGRSTPHAETADNNTEALIADMEAIRNKLGIDAWVLFGGSWGATLSLAYAQRYPQRVLGMVLRGVFLCRDRDLHWFYRDGANRIFPEYWEELCAAVPRPREGDYLRAFHRALSNDNELARMAAAKAWVQWEARCSTFHHHSPSQAHESPNVLAMAVLETHYFMQRGFLRDKQLLENAGQLAGIPGIIVHGRYDMVCTLENALALHRAWPDSELHIVDAAGHAASEPAIVHALVEVTDALAAELCED